MVSIGNSTTKRTTAPPHRQEDIVSEYFIVLSIVSAVIGAYYAFKATMDDGVANAAVLLVIISALSYAAAYASVPHRLAQFEQEILR
jgi:hypothetical protein